MAKKYVPSASCTVARTISCTEPFSSNGGLYTNTNGTKNPTIANVNPLRPVFIASPPAIPAAVYEATQTGGVICAIIP